MFAPRFILNDQLDLHFHTASLRPSRLPTTVAVVDLSHAGAAGRGARCRESHALRHEIAHRLAPHRATPLPDVASMPGWYSPATQDRPRRQPHPIARGRLQRRT